VLYRILNLVLIAIVIAVLYKYLWKTSSGKDKKFQGKSNFPLEAMHRDPICGTYIPESQAISLKVKQDTIYFCSEKCKTQFITEQQK
jgi:YHS domain-containing protein